MPTSDAGLGVSARWLDCGFDRAHAAQTWLGGDLALGIFKVAALFYFTVALIVGWTHDVPTDSGNPIAQAVGYGLMWPWLVIKFGPWPN